MATDSQVVASCLRKLSTLRPSLGLVLGSGFGAVASEIRDKADIAYHQLPGMPVTGVEGHSGKVVVGYLGGTPVLVLQGRAHYYEGHSMASVTFPIRVLAEFGIRAVLLTNAAGGINPQFRPGDFMRVTDHLNFMGENPLRGPATDGKTRFVDMTKPYDRRLSSLLQRAATRTRVRLHSGVYAAVAGPSYETPAECRAFAKLGADAVGMSTVPEVIVARQCGMAVAGLSCITNLASCHTKEPLSHAEVLAVGEKARNRAARLVGNFAQLYGKSAEDY